MTRPLKHTFAAMQQDHAQLGTILKRIVVATHREPARRLHMLKIGYELFQMLSEEIHKGEGFPADLFAKEIADEIGVASSVPPSVTEEVRAAPAESERDDVAASVTREVEPVKRKDKARTKANGKSRRTASA